MERIVYLLGAGFSEPLGLPLVKNFREKSQDLYLSGEERFSYFGEVFSEITKLSAIKNFYHADLFDIEEVLSLLAMGDFLGGNPLKDLFIRYIRDVIQALTPPIPHTNGLAVNWQENLFGVPTQPSADSLIARNWRVYGYFVGALLGLNFTRGSGDGAKGILCSTLPPSIQNTHYSIITLNYDTIPEMVADYCISEYQPIDKGTDGSEPRQIIRATMRAKEPFGIDGSVCIAKLHGSIDGGPIIPPTWSKGADPEVIPEWNLAYKMLSNATQLRVIGFSLPTGDAYVKYLLKSASEKNPLLKQIDVICLDPDESVYQRYSEFVSTHKFRFARRSTFFYLGAHLDSYNQPGQAQLGSLSLTNLESAHENFMAKPNYP